MIFFKRLLRLVPVLIILTVLPRVYSFVRSLSPASPGFDLHDLISAAFALSLGLGTIANSYFSSQQPRPEYEEDPRTPREARRREREAAYYATMHAAAPSAAAATILFAALDGMFNLADAIYGATINGSLNSTGIILWVYVAAVVTFGLSPTILSVVLARVVSLVDRIPENYERPARDNEIDWVRTVLGNLGIREYEKTPVALTQDELRTELRTKKPNKPRDSKSEEIRRWLSEVSRPDYTPTVSEIVARFNVAKSTASEVRTQWIIERNPWRSNGISDRR